jgi:hypothetical protein
MNNFYLIVFICFIIKQTCNHYGMHPFGKHPISLNILGISTLLMEILTIMFYQICSYFLLLSFII